jgi:hypothetical protein
MPRRQALPDVDTDSVPSQASRLPAPPPMATQLEAGPSRSPLRRLLMTRPTITAVIVTMTAPMLVSVDLMATAATAAAANCVSITTHHDTKERESKTC